MLRTPYRINRNYPAYDEICNRWGRSFHIFYSALAAFDISPTSPAFQGVSFTGSFDGHGHAISNLNIDSPGDFVGLFGYINEDAGEIQNLSLKNVNVKGRERVGGIAGDSAANIYSCNVEGRVTGIDTLGFIAGMNYGIIISSQVRGDLIGGENVGGICGENHGLIQNCHSSGNVTATQGLCGGIAGDNTSDIIFSSSNSNLAGRHVGGICGWTGSGYYTYSRIRDCYANCTIAVTDEDGVAGGVAGYNFESITDCYSASTFVYGTDFTGYIGGFVGMDNSLNPDQTEKAVYDACFWDYSVAGEHPGVGYSQSGSLIEVDPDGVYPRNTTAMKTMSNFTSYGWDFVGETTNGYSDKWTIVENETYPRFVNECINPPAGDVNGDCVHDMLDFAANASGWLECGLITQDMCP
ncbi:GLUG motif-containing protein [Limihaloglobus sulfuriphilus]|uniref:GLUG motif-containing protein n=1 Tax=Limihaloglobus sulfuriphilus TaxID=1851148 RepID=UPI001649B7AB|nr:GLUG motif-containing protein [Limihaloglobus sulfuriphilus]